jgi:hypothetical protein
VEPHWAALAHEQEHRRADSAGVFAGERGACSSGDRPFSLLGRIVHRHLTLPRGKAIELTGTTIYGVGE